MAQFNRHMIVTHKITRVHNNFQIERDALSGRPQCRHCHYRFPDWRGLRRHIIDDSCPLFDPNQSLQEPPADQRIFREFAQADAWMALIEQPELIRVLREHCVLCGKQCLTGKAMLEHLNLSHYDMWNESKIHAPVIINALRDAHPCQACGVTTPKAHACHVIRQMAIAHLLQHSDMIGRPRTWSRGKQLPPCLRNQLSTGSSLILAKGYVRHPGRPRVSNPSTRTIQAGTALMALPLVPTAKASRATTLHFEGTLNPVAAMPST